MKKVLVVILTLILLFTAIGCSETSSQSNPGENEMRLKSVSEMTLYYVTDANSPDSYLAEVNFIDSLIEVTVSGKTKTYVIQDITVLSEYIKSNVDSFSDEDSIDNKKQSDDSIVLWNLRVIPETGEHIVLYSINGYPKALSELILLLNKLIGEEALPGV